jgi:hypothetical protein
MPGNKLNAGSGLEAAVANNTDVRYSHNPFFSPSLLTPQCHVRSPITALHLQLALRAQTEAQDISRVDAGTDSLADTSGELSPYHQ